MRPRDDLTVSQCNNWAKRTANGRMVGYWPGSAVHQRETLREPRFEDFEYSSFDEDEDDCLAWMGNGMIMASVEGRSTSAYLDYADVPTIDNFESLKLTSSTPSTPFSMVDM
jgi:hypothetical protein